MRLKGILSDRGLRALEKSFLPALEKFGREVQLLFTETDLHLFMGAQEADGVHVLARLAVVRLLFL
jgi:HUS1 checkpoint protein